MSTHPATDKETLAALVRATVAALADRPAFGLEQAKRLAAAAERAAQDLAVPVVVAIADAAGSLMLLQRMDGTLPGSTDIAINKAFTAAAFRLPTDELGRLAQPGQPLYGIQTTNQGRVVLFGGGLPCRSGGVVVGAIGISGGTAEQDVRIAAQALQTFSE
ncbi:GlcG/HbpS family heme-binding protein [Oleisolibacter albus]|uniref:GlcG/HbpS family heme-binding protein n=1 Tax=Oleisolibacter albus TaxID=2171757 RepID=UPI000DF2877F|nr:heme-binding protein [Oleisolibacter albus]